MSWPSSYITYENVKRLQPDQAMASATPAQLAQVFGAHRLKGPGPVAVRPPFRRERPWAGVPGGTREIRPAVPAPPAPPPARLARHGGVIHQDRNDRHVPVESILDFPPDVIVRVFNAATTQVIRRGQPIRTDDSQQYLAARHRVVNSLGEAGARPDRVIVDENLACAQNYQRDESATRG
jgi:hypothetical protein